MSTTKNTALAENAELIRLGVQPRLGSYVRDIWARRAFVATIARGDLRAQNQNTVLGSLWHLLNPLFLAAVYYLLFGIIFRASRDIENYPAFLIIGIFVFTFTNKTIMTGTRTIVSNLSLMQALTFPRAVLPLAGVTTETIAQLSAMAALLIIVLFTGEAAGISWFLILPALALQAVFAAGLSLFAARLTYHFRDVQQALPYLLRLWLYMSGTMFSVDFVDRHGIEWASTLFRLNPMYAFMTIFRDALLDQRFRLEYWALAAGWAVALAVAGFVFFWRNETEYSRG